MVLRLMERAAPLILELWEGERENISRRELLQAFQRADRAEENMHQALEGGANDDEDAEETEGAAGR